MSELTAILQKRLAGNDRQFVHYNNVWYSTDRFRDDVLTVQHYLSNQQIEMGARVLLADGNSYAFLVVYVALLTSGMTIIPINPQMPVPELRKVFVRSEAIGVFIDPALAPNFDLVPTQADELGLKPLRSACKFLILIQDALNTFSFTPVAPEDGQIRPLPASALRPNSSYPTILPQIPENAPAILLFTSGTTGTPKGVALTHSQIMATIHNIADSHHLTARDVSYCFLPLFHINAQVIAFLSTMYSGGKLVVEDKFSASKFWKIIREHNVTWVSAVPTVIAILVKTAEPRPAPSSLRFVRSASAPLPAFQARRFEALFGVPVVESYGMTEAASQICVNPVPPGKRKIGSVGLPVGVQLQIVDTEGHSLSPGEIGEIAIRGDSVIAEYAYVDEHGQSFQDGWFCTGDVGYVDGEGYVFITGRSKEMINRAGQKISPREVEEVVAKHSDVQSVAVIGLPDPLYGERVVAYLISEGSHHMDENTATALRTELDQLCRNNLSAYKCPVEYFFVDSIPVGPTGKIQRARLRQLVLAGGRA